VRPFPVLVYPKTLRKFIRSIATVLPCPVDFPGAMLLAALATFIGRKQSIAISESWIEYAVLWIACIARSGDRKTPAFDKIMAPLRRKQEELLAEYLKAKAKYKQLSAEEQAKQEKPKLGQMMTTDSTMEGLKKALDGNPNGIAYTADELTGWANGMNQYKGGKGNDLANWLSAWSSQTIIVNRAGQPEPIIIAKPFVPVLGGLQPNRLPELTENFQEDLPARILFAYPPSMPPGEWSEEIIEGSKGYAKVCEALWKLKASAKPIEFSIEAKAIWIEWVNNHRRHEPPDNLRAAWSKLEGYCLRLTLVLFLARRACQETNSSKIDPASIKGAIKLIAYFKSHAWRVYSSAADQSDKGRIGRALRWIKAAGGIVTAKKIHQYRVGDCETADDAKQLLDDLAELGHGTVTKKARGSIEFRLGRLVDESTGQPKGDEK
jgi:hypothetical protein